MTDNNQQPEMPVDLYDDLYRIASYLVEISEYKSFSTHHFLPLFEQAKVAIKKAEEYHLEQQRQPHPFNKEKGIDAALQKILDSVESAFVEGAGSSPHGNFVLGIVYGYNQLIAAFPNLKSTQSEPRQPHPEDVKEVEKTILRAMDDLLSIRGPGIPVAANRISGKENLAKYLAEWMTGFWSVAEDAQNERDQYKADCGAAREEAKAYREMLESIRPSYLALDIQDLLDRYPQTHVTDKTE